jgi:hypothetical protein
MQTAQTAYCIFIDTVAEGTIPSVRDGDGNPCVFATRGEAEREIADNMMTRLQEFMDGERDFEDAITVEEYVDVVDVLADGSIVDSDRRRLGGSHGALPQTPKFSALMPPAGTGEQMPDRAAPIPPKVRPPRAEGWVACRR